MGTPQHTTQSCETGPRKFFWNGSVMRWIWMTLLVASAGCATYHPQPLDPGKSLDDWDGRSLNSPELRAFLATNGVAMPEAGEPWNLKQLTLAALDFQPALAEARTQLLSAQAAQITACERPNPSVTVTPGYDSQIPGSPSPWLVPLSFDLPLETAGKRWKRMAEARAQAEAARWTLAGAVWQVRSQVRAALANLHAQLLITSILEDEATEQNRLVQLLEDQFKAGSLSGYELTQARINAANTLLAKLDAQAKATQARLDLARTLGLPSKALLNVRLDFKELDAAPGYLNKSDIRRETLLNRSDIRAALASYAATEAALQLEIANQYPDIHLGPGYAWNNGSAGDNEWSLGLTLSLPVFNHNEGPVAQAEANRQAAAAHFLTVQANAEADLDSALAGWHAAQQQIQAAHAMLEQSRKLLDSARAQARSGESAPATVAEAAVGFAAARQADINAVIQGQQALGQLEDVIQYPLAPAPAGIQPKPHTDHPLSP